MTWTPRHPDMIRVRDFLREHPGATTGEIAAALNLPHSFGLASKLAAVAKHGGVVRRRTKSEAGTRCGPSETSRWWLPGTMAEWTPRSGHISRIKERLQRGPACTRELADIAGITVSEVAVHLHQEARRRGSVRRVPMWEIV